MCWRESLIIRRKNIMSHFITLVFTKENGRTVEELLAPYDENIVYAPYVLYTREQAIAKIRKEIEDYKNGPLSGRSVFINSTPADFNAISAITIPIGAGDAHTKPNGLPIGTSNALLIASPHLALYWNSI